MIPRGISEIFSNLLKVDDFFLVYVKVNKNNHINSDIYEALDTRYRSTSLNNFFFCRWRGIPWVCIAKVRVSK